MRHINIRNMTLLSIAQQFLLYYLGLLTSLEIFKNIVIGHWLKHKNPLAYGFWLDKHPLSGGSKT